MNKLPSIIIPDTSSISINNQETLEQATSLLSTLNKNLDILTAHKEEKTKPINAALKAIRADYKPLETQLTDAITQIKTSITTYVNVQIQEAKRLEEKILADMRTSPTTKIDKLSVIDQSATDKINTTTGSVSFVTKKCWRITDATLIPATYLIPNDAMINEAMKDNTNVPGIEFYTEKTLRNYR